MSYENSEISEIYSTQGESKAEISTNKKVEGKVFQTIREKKKNLF